MIPFSTLINFSLPYLVDEMVKNDASNKMNTEKYTFTL